MLGFMPGFPYLGGLDEKLHKPRLETPRVRIPAGSVGIGRNIGLELLGLRAADAEEAALEILEVNRVRDVVHERVEHGRGGFLRVSAVTVPASFASISVDPRPAVDVS